MLLLLGAIQIASMRLEVQTFDEGNHMAAGYSYLSQGDYRMNPEHPPLGKLLAAVPLLWFRPAVPAKSDAWFQAKQWEFSDEFLYGGNLDVDSALFAARLPAVAVTLALAFAVAWWTRRRFGPAVGLLAMGFVVFDPNLIAHGRYVTSDVIVSLFIFLPIALWLDYLESDRFRTLAGASAAFGLALASKFSALILIPILAMIYIVWAAKRRSFSIRHALISCATPVAIAALIIGAVYFRETGRLLSGKTTSSLYGVGLQVVRDHNKEGLEAYMLGERRREGVWAYFPEAFLVKTPSGVLVMMLILAMRVMRHAIRLRPRLKDVPFVWLALPFAAASYFLWCMSSGINLGVRHLLPFFPLLYVMLAAATTWLDCRRRLAIIALALVAAESLLAYPHYLAFFNGFSGGSGRGPEYLVDSNIDWGQDVKKLRTYLALIGDPPLCIDYFGTANLRYYGIKEGYLPRGKPEEIESADCVAAVSVTLLKGVYVDPKWYAWLDARTPMAKVGWSIYVYDLRRPPSTR